MSISVLAAVILCLILKCSANLHAAIVSFVEQSSPAVNGDDGASTANDCHAKVAKAIASVISEPPSGAPLRVDAVEPSADALPSDIELHARALLRLMKQEVKEWEDAPARAEAEAHLDVLTLARFVVATINTSPSPRPKITGEVVTAAAAFFRRAMAWRAEWRVAELLEEFHPRRMAEPVGAGETATTPAAATGQTARTVRQAAAWSHFYNGYGGRTKDGGFFMVERIGAADHASICSSPELLTVMKGALLANYELLFRTARASSAALGHQVYGLVVADARGASLGLLRHLELIKFAAANVAANFPEATQKVLIVNAPRAVAVLWSAVSGLLPESVRAKCRVLSEAATRDALRDLVEVAELPRFLGGERPEAMSCVPLAQKVPKGAWASRS